MKKIATLIVGSCLSTSILAAGSGWFSSLFSSEKEDILTYVPADTAYYLGGDSAEEIVEIMNTSTLSSPRFAEKLNTELNADNSDELPAAKFLTYFLDQYTHANDTGLTDLAKASGISFTGSYALFGDGLLPVARINVVNTKAVDVLIENAVKDSGWEYRWENIGEEKVRFWPLENDAFLAVLNNDKGVVITIITKFDTLEDKKRRLGLTKPEASLATNNKVETLKTQYGYTDDMIAFLQIDRIAQAFLSPKNSRLGQDLLTYLPKRDFGQFQRGLTEECRVEFSEFASAMPRFVTGYQSLEANLNEASYTVHSVLELKNEAVNVFLQNSQGYLPLHSTTAKDKLLAFGVGIDGDNLGLEFLSLIDQLAGAHYNCAVLENLTGVTMSLDPMAVVNTSSLIYGVKGVGVSLFDFTLEDNSTFPESVDFLISIATEDPVTLLDNAKKFPLTPQITLPSDGSAVSLDLPIETQVDVKAAIKGSHLVIFSGEQSEILANKLITEPIDSNGLVSVAINFQKLGELLSSEDLSQSFATMPFDDACSIQYELAHMFQSLNAENALLVSAESEGFTTKYSGYLDKTKSKNINLVGEYSVSYLDDDCQWIGANDVESTRDQIRENGTGLYAVKDEANMCDLYISDYTWQQNGNKFVVNSQDQERDTCDTELSSAEQTDYTCYLVDDKDAEFLCVYSFDGYLSVEKYTRLEN